MICAFHVEHLANKYNQPKTTSWHWYVCVWERERERERVRYKTLCILAYEESSVNAFMEAF